MNEQKPAKLWGPKEWVAAIGMLLLGAGVAREFSIGWGLVACGSVLLLLVFLPALRGASHEPNRPRRR